MKKTTAAILSLFFLLGVALTGCSDSSEPSTQTPNGSSSSAEAQDTAPDEEASSEPQALTEPEVRFGDEGAPFTLHLYDNETAAAIAGYVGTTDWRLPISDFDDTDVMEFYDIPDRYEIPSNPETVTSVKAGEAYYSDPNRIVLYFGDAEVSEEYTPVGTFDATEEFISAVQNNPILEGWDTKIVNISDGR